MTDKGQDEIQQQGIYLGGQDAGSWHSLWPDRKEAVRRLKTDSVLYSRFRSLREDWQERLLDCMTGCKTLPLTYDPVFKKIFNADIHPERLSGLLSAVLGKDVTVHSILPAEEIMPGGGALLIMDILVRLSNGSLANVEIQKIPYLFPAERMSCYSADLLLREYSRARGEKGKGKFTYHNLKKVYTVVIFEESPTGFWDENRDKYFIHHGKTTFDTGLPMELLQEYYLIALDVFRERHYTEDIYNTLEKPTESRAEKNSLKAWLSLLAVSDMCEVDAVIRRYPWLEEIYREMADYMHRQGEVIDMFSEALRILDQNTVEYMVDEMREEINNQKAQIISQGRELAEKDQLLVAREEEIKRLTALLKKTQQNPSKNI